MTPRAVPATRCINPCAWALMPGLSDKEKFERYKMKTKQLVEQYGGLSGVKSS